MRNYVVGHTIEGNRYIEGEVYLNHVE